MRLYSIEGHIYYYRPDLDTMADFFKQLDEDIKNSFLGGGARVTSVKGVGKKTEQKLRKAGIESIGDLNFQRPDELAKASGLSESRVRTIIGNAGFTPLQTEEEQKADRERTRVNRGPKWEDNFEFSVADKTDAQEFNLLRRSQQAVKTDKLFRAPITTDIDEYKANPDKLDFPHADTPVSSGGSRDSFDVGKLTEDMFDIKPKDKVDLSDDDFPPTTDYETRVRQLEAQGLTRSDAQGVADAERL